uniref:Uncharacterized protein n=1 Tax=Oryza punctata TaxID=4537 RepID=A0A0E0KJB0_ORYPU
MKLNTTTTLALLLLLLLASSSLHVSMAGSGTSCLEAFSRAFLVQVTSGPSFAPESTSSWPLSASIPQKIDEPANVPRN